MDTQTLINDLNVVHASTGNLAQYQDDLDAIRKKLDAIRGEVARLRPGQKGYTDDLSRLSAIANSLERQLDSGELAILAEARELQEQAVRQPDHAAELYRELQSLDNQIVEALLLTRDLVMQRQAFTDERLIPVTSILIGWVQELGLSDIWIPRPDFPWRKPYPRSWQTALQDWVSRFLGVAGYDAVQPASDQTPRDFIGQGR